jgi:basic amino acid/polyamine antiporter, APA family
MKPTTPTPATGLIRSIGPIMATAIIIGTVIGSGIFKKPYTIAQVVPEFGLVALVWVLGGLLVLVGALAYAEVAVLLPQAGGNYVFLRESYGRLAGFLWGWVDFLIIKAASLAALATIFAESFNDLLHTHAPPYVLTFWGERLLTVAVMLGLAWINSRGTRWGGGLQVFITCVKVGSLLFILLLPFVIMAFVSPSPSATLPSSANLEPIWPKDWSQVRFTGLATAFLGVLWAYHGWQNLTPVAAEVTQPQRNLPLALLLGVGAIVFLYLGVNLAYYFVLPGTEMKALPENTTVAAEFCRRLLGPGWGTLASVAIMCSVFGALNGLLLVTPRMLFAMGEDGLAPPALRRIHPRYHTPTTAIWVMAGWASILVGAVAVLKVTGVLEKIKSPFDVLTDFAMFGAVIFETAAVMAIFVLRFKMPFAPRPYRCWGYPVVPALYVILPACVLGNMFISQRIEAMTGTAFIMVGVVVYYLCDLPNTGGEKMFASTFSDETRAPETKLGRAADPEGIQGLGGVQEPKRKADD